MLNLQLLKWCSSEEVLVPFHWTWWVWWVEQMVRLITLTLTDVVVVLCILTGVINARADRADLIRWAEKGIHFGETIIIIKPASTPRSSLPNLHWRPISCLRSQRTSVRGLREGRASPGSYVTAFHPQLSGSLQFKTPLENTAGVGLSDWIYQLHNLQVELHSGVFFSFYIQNLNVSEWKALRSFWWYSRDHSYHILWYESSCYVQHKVPTAKCRRQKQPRRDRPRKSEVSRVWAHFQMKWNRSSVQCQTRWPPEHAVMPIASQQKSHRADKANANVSHEQTSLPFCLCKRHLLARG